VVEVRIDCGTAEVTGDLVIPPDVSQPPCLLIIGGSSSLDRNGNTLLPKAPPRDALTRLAQVLAAGGYASLRYDQVGCRDSRARTGFSGTYADRARIVTALVRYLRDSRRFGKIIILAESAGAYVSSLAARSGTEADASILLGPFCGPPEELFDFNYARLVRYVESSPERKRWAANRFRFELLLGKQYREMLAAARQGRDTFELQDDDFVARIGVVRRREELENPPDRMLRFISSPVLVLAGEFDLNVPPNHAHRAAEVMRDGGNSDVDVSLIARADHSFQIPPENEDTRFRERYTFDSFRRPYQPGLYLAILGWLAEQAPTGIEPDPQEVNTIAARRTPGF